MKTSTVQFATPEELMQVIEAEHALAANGPAFPKVCLVSKKDQAAYNKMAFSWTSIVLADNPSGGVEAQWTAEGTTQVQSSDGQREGFATFLYPDE